MKIEITLPWFLLLFFLFSTIQFVSTIWIKATLEKSIASKYDKILEDYKYNLKIRERAEKVAEYMALQINIKESSLVFPRFLGHSVELGCHCFQLK